MWEEFHFFHNDCIKPKYGYNASVYNHYPDLSECGTCYIPHNRTDIFKILGHYTLSMIIFSY